MNRKQSLVTLGAVAGAAAVIIIMLQRGHEKARRTPAWNDPQQPVEGTGGEPTGLPLMPSPVASWNAVRPGSPRLGAGSVVMRDYHPTLLDDPESLVR